MAGHTTARTASVRTRRILAGSVQRCGDVHEWFGHLFYPGYMLTEAYHRYYNENVVVVQLRLRDLGYAPLGIDGVYGPQTAGA